MSDHRSQARSQASGKSCESAASSMNCRGIDIQHAVLLPLSQLLLINIPAHFAINLVYQLSYLLELYIILFYLGPAYAATVATLQPLIYLSTHAITLAVNRATSELVAQFLQAAQMVASNTIFTYGLTISIIFSTIAISVLIALSGTIAQTFTSYLVEDGKKYIELVGGLGCAMGIFSTSMKPYYRVENRKSIEFYMEIGYVLVKLTVLMFLMSLFISSKGKEGTTNIMIVVIAELSGQGFALMISLLALVPALSKASGLKLAAKFDVKLFNPFRFKVLLNILKAIIPFYLYEARWALQTIPVFVSTIFNEKGSEYQQFIIIFTYYMIRMGKIASSVNFASEPVMLAIGSINMSVKRFDRVFKLVLQSLVLITAVSFSFAFICFVAAPAITNVLFEMQNSSLTKMFTAEELETWAESFNFLKWGMLDGIALSPLQVCQNVAIFTSKPYKLAIYSIFAIIIDCALCAALVTQEGINQPLYQSIYFAEVALMLFQIPVLVSQLFSLYKLQNVLSVKPDGELANLQDVYKDEDVNNNEVRSPVDDLNKSELINVTRNDLSGLNGQSIDFYKNSMMEEDKKPQINLINSLLGSKRESQVSRNSKAESKTSDDIGKAPLDE